MMKKCHDLMKKMTEFSVVYWLKFQQELM